MNKLYAEYFQKSKVFLYPILGIAKKSSIQVKNTYISWGDAYKEADQKLILQYEDVNTEAFEAFKDKVLLTSPLYETHITTPDYQGIFVFDMSVLVKDWELFINGKYSRFSKILKDGILKYYGSKSPEYDYVRSYLYPSEYFHIYADLLNVQESLLMEVGELCDKYNPELEKLNIFVELLESSSELT